MTTFIKSIGWLALVTLLTANAAAANFPYIRLNNQTNRISDNGTALTRDGVAIGGGSGIPGTVSNAVASAGLLAVDSSKTNGIAATPAHIVATLGFTPANSNSVPAIPTGTMINTGTPAVGAISKASDVTGTNWTPSKLTIASDTINWPTNITSGITLSMPSQSGVATNLPWNMARFSAANGDGTFNELLQIGYNIDGTGNRLSTNDTSLSWAMEGAYLGLTEMHLVFTDLTNTQTRVESWTISKTNPANRFKYWTGSSFEFRDSSYLTNAAMLYFNDVELDYTTHAAAALGRGVKLTDDGGLVTLARTGGAANQDFTATDAEGWRNFKLPGATFNSGGITASAFISQSGNVGVTMGTGGVEKIRIRPSNGYIAASDTQYTFSDSTTSPGSPDTGFARQAAGVARVSDASTGVGKWLYRNTVTVGGDITLGTTNSIVILNVDNKTATLPAAATANQGKEYTIKVVAPASTGTVSGTIDGVSGFSLSASNKFIRVASDGTNWWNVGSN